MQIKRPSISAITAILLCGLATTALAQDSRTYTYDALGRLIEQESDGPPNDSEVHSICYDAAGNRTQYRTSDDGTSAGCDAGDPIAMASASAGQGSATVGASLQSPANSGPNTTADYDEGACNTLGTLNLTANDSDPEQNYPLTLSAISAGTGPATATISSVSSVDVAYGQQTGTTQFNYTVTDSQGATSIGVLDIDTTCGGGGSAEEV